MLARLVPYLLFQMIVIASILVLRLLQQSDPDDFASSEFTLQRVNAAAFHRATNEPPLYDASKFCAEHIGKPPQMNACPRNNKAKLSDACRKVLPQGLGVAWRLMRRLS